MHGFLVEVWNVHFSTFNPISNFNSNPNKIEKNAI